MTAHLRSLRRPLLRRAAAGWFDGVAVELPDCVVCDVDEGRMLLDEYLDSAHGARLGGPD